MLVFHASSVCHAAEGLQRLQLGTEASKWALAHCSCANMVEMRSVTEPGTDTHRWLSVIEGCPLSAAWPQQLRNTDGNRSIISPSSDISVCLHQTAKE